MTAGIGPEPGDVPVIDCHMHVRGGRGGQLDEQYCDWIIEAGDVLGIDRFYVSDLRLTGPLRYEDFHAGNDRTLAAVRRHPKRLSGYCFVNPGDPRCLDEITQRVRDEAFAGIKLYNQYFIDELVTEPVLALASEWQIPVLVHAGYPTDAVTRANQPRISTAAHFVNAARRFPDAVLIEAHIGGGGDWEWALEHLREAPTVYLDTGGSGVDEWMVDQCVAALGVERILFATDMTMEGGVGKILDANLTESERRLVFGGNFQRILERRRVH